MQPFDSPVRRSPVAPGWWRLFRLFLMALAISLWVLPVRQARSAPAPVTVLTVDGPIGPATADYIVRGIGRASDGGHQLIILKMDTPGGLDTSMRTIVKAIVNSPVPVASYVAPGGARAASAGTYILYASHIAAMAPGTNVGAATPVALGPPGNGPPEQQGKRDGSSPDRRPAQSDEPAQARKLLNDSVAYLRGLAQARGRNADWAEQAVRASASLPAEEALRQHVVDYIASDVTALLSMLDGKTVKTTGEERHLHLAGTAIHDVQPDWRTRILSATANPTVALLLLTVGIYGLLFEFMSPGFAVPGVIGGICLLLGLYGLQLLPVNYAGLALMLLGVALMVTEAFLPSFGVLGIGGIAAFVVGAMMLIDTDVPGFGVPVGLVGGIAAAGALLMGATITVAMRTRRKAAGGDSLLGRSGRIVQSGDGGVWASIDGALWRVEGADRLAPGQAVQVVGRKGLLLRVAPDSNNNQPEKVGKS